MNPRGKGLCVYIGSTGSARKEMHVSIYIFIKKKRFPLANISPKKDYVKRVTNVSIDM